MSALLRLEGEPRALALAAIDRLGSKKAVAARIGYSRTALSLALSGGYRASTLKPLEQAIRQAFEASVACPHLGEEITPTLCLDYRERPLHTADPRSVRHWQACRYCPMNPASHATPAAGSSVSSHQPKRNTP